MPWCPKCKSEYREGFSKCADCGSTLVDDEMFARLEAESAAARESAITGMDGEWESGFLEREALESSVPDAGKDECASDTEATDKAFSMDGELSMEEALSMEETLSVGEDLSTEAGLSMEEKFSGEDKEEEQDLGQFHSPSAGAEGGSVSGQKKRAVYTTSLYRDNAERASENRSSAWVLMVVGGVGIVVLVLGIMGVIPLHFSNAYLFYGVMAAVFILFLVAGIISMKNALVFEKSAESENVVRTTLLEWCRLNLHGDELDRQIGAAEGEAKEILYFMRFEAIKARLNHQFLNLDQGFLEKLIDDTIYDMVYEGHEKSA